MLIALLGVHPCVAFLQPHGGASPNRLTQSLIAVLAGLQVPFLYTETHELGEEIVASYLYQVHLYHGWKPMVTGDF